WIKDTLTSSGPRLRNRQSWFRPILEQLEERELLSANLLQQPSLVAISSSMLPADNTPPTATPLAATNAVFSPNASSGIKDTTTFHSTLTDASAVTWTLTLKNHNSTTVRIYTGAGNVSQLWDGKMSPSNAFVGDGLYTATLTYKDAAGNAGIPTSKVV